MQRHFGMKLIKREKIMMLNQPYLICRFFNYFKETFSGGDILTNHDIENELHSEESSNTCIDLLDRLFVVDDVKRAISALKRGKSGGADLFIPEMFLECKDILSPLTVCTAMAFGSNYYN